MGDDKLCCGCSAINSLELNGTLAAVHKGLLSTGKSSLEVISTENAAFMAWNGMSLSDDNFCSSGLNGDEEKPVSHSFVLNNNNTFINHQAHSPESIQWPEEDSLSISRPMREYLSTGHFMRG